VGTDWTVSSRHTGPSGEDGGRILYVMRTFLAFLHIGKVLCVTDQTPSSHSSGGACHSAGGVREYFLGLRRVMERVGFVWEEEGAGLLSSAGAAVAALSGLIEDGSIVSGSIVLNSVIPAGSGLVTLRGEVRIRSAMFVRCFTVCCFDLFLSENVWVYNIWK
jgi:hypothetical protein